MTHIISISSRRLLFTSRKMENLKSKINPLPHFYNMPLYESGESAIQGKENVVKLSANENMNGPCKEVLNQFEYYSKNIFEYPDSNHFALRRKIGQVHNIDPNRIICGAGSDEVIQLLCRSFCGKNDEVIYTEHGFLMYKLSALATGAKPVEVKETNRTASIENISKAITARTKIIFIANPNNPTGTMISDIEIEQLLEKIPNNILLVLDGAYSEYVDSFDGGISLVNRYSNVFVTRTFSKIFGLGGLRVGWGYGARDITDVLNSLRSPFNVSSLGLKMAELSIADSNFVKEQRELNRENRDLLRNRLLDFGLKIDKSFANFLLLRFANEEQVNAVDLFLKEKGFILRRVDAYGLPKCLRLSIGNKEICEKLYLTLAEFFNNNDRV